MSIQSDDFVYINDKKYVLIDIEIGKQIIDSAYFIMPEHEYVLITNTGCWRGYTAEYYIIDNILHGIKDMNFSQKGTKIKSQLTMMPYTGSCIIAGINEGKARHISDFIETYITFDEAYELYFDTGVLKEQLSLSSAVMEYKDICETDDYKNNMQPDERRQLMVKIARKPLKYKYDSVTYKWWTDKNSICYKENLEKEYDYIVGLVADECVRNMSKKERKAFRAHPKLDDYYSEYKLFIRNKYEKLFDKDKTMLPIIDKMPIDVLEKIRSIIMPDYVTPNE